MWLIELLPLLLPLPALPVLQLDEAHGTSGAAWLPALFDAVAACGSAALRPHRALLGQVLLEVLEAPRAALGESATLLCRMPLLLDAIRTEMRAPQPPSGFALLLPLLRCTLLTDPTTCASPAEAREAQETAFVLLQEHCVGSLQLDQPARRTQAELLLALMARGELWQARAADALMTVGSALLPGSLAELLGSAIYAESAGQRTMSLSALAEVAALREGWHEADEALAAQLWLARSDEAKECVQRAEALWGMYTGCEAVEDGKLPETLDSELLSLVGAQEARVRSQVARALASCATAVPARLHGMLQRLFELYKSNVPATTTPASPSRFAQREEELPEDDWRTRLGVGTSLAALAPTLRAREQLPLVFTFLKRALADAHEAVAAEMATAGRQIIEKQSQPQEMVTLLVPLFDSFLAEKATSETDDRVRQGIVLYMGSIAKHIPADDPKVHQVLQRLLAALSTPSESVQRTIAGSLSSLLGTPAMKPKAAEHLAPLLHTLLHTNSYPERRGAAFGLAGVVKAAGIPSLKQHGVMAALQAAIEEKKKGDAMVNAREGALNAFECLCEALGRLFEPYVPPLLPLLLMCVADGSGAVRHAAVAASERIMANLSAMGVKMVLPALLKALDEDKWRTKHAAVELLGAMAYCAPKQLSNTLPQVVPALTETLTDAHPRVKEGANDALKSVGAVIKNPEIARLVPTLLKALSDPGNATPAALDALAHCQFEHCIDPPSLALIVPVLHRGLKERMVRVRVWVRVRVRVRLTLTLTLG
jgi:hypothetical protein